MDNHKTNLLVAAAIGHTITDSLMVALSQPGTMLDVSGEPGERILAYYTAESRRVRFSPSTSPADALAALEAFCKAKGWTAALGCFGGQWSVCLPAHAVGVSGEFCEAVCKAILEAANG